MGSSRETEWRHAPVMFLAAAVAMARGPTVAIEAEVREDTTKAHPDKETRDESIGLRVIVPFRATREADSR